MNGWIALVLSSKFIFPRPTANSFNIINIDPQPSINYQLQLGTYGYAIKEEFGRCDGLFLMCYNKDTSIVKEVTVNLDFIDQSYNYWIRVQDLHKNGLPSLQDGESPVMAWECKYCQYKDLCDERG